MTYNALQYKSRKLYYFSDWWRENPHPRADIAQDLTGFLSRQSDNYRAILNALTSYFIKFKNSTCPSHAALASETGLSIRTIGYYLSLMAEQGIIAKNYRHLQTCLYSVTGLLFNRQKSMKLSNLLPALRSWFSRYLPTIDKYIISKFNYSSFIYKTDGRGDITILDNDIDGDKTTDIEQSDIRLSQSDKPLSASTTKTGRQGDVLYRLSLSTPYSKKEEAIEGYNNINPRKIGREREMDDRQMKIFEAVSIDPKNVEQYLTPTMLKAAKLLGMSLHQAAGMLGMEELVLREGIKAAQNKMHDLTNPPLFFFKVCSNIGKERMIKTDTNFSRQIQAFLEDFKQPKYDFKNAPTDNQSNENQPRAPQQAAAKPHAFPFAGTQKGKTLPDRDDMLLRKDWPMHMLIPFEPKGVQRAREEAWANWEKDEYYPWKQWPDIQEMIDAGYSFKQIDEFFGRELDIYGALDKKLTDEIKAVGEFTVPGMCRKVQHGIVKRKLDEILQCMKALPSRTAKDTEEVLMIELKNRLQRLKNQQGDTK